MVQDGQKLKGKIRIDRSDDQNVLTSDRSGC